MNEKMRKLMKLYDEHKSSFTNVRMLFLTEREFIWLYYGNCSQEFFSEDYIVRVLPLDRGKILEWFSKLELVINELIQLQLLGFNSEHAEELDILLGRLNIWSKAGLLKKWNIIDNDLFDKLMKINQVRNKFAHVWDEKEVMYWTQYTKESIKESPFRLLFEDIEKEFESEEEITVKTSIRTLFNDFKQDFEDVWKGLIVLYKMEQEKFDLDALIKQVQKD
jgi:hypothetical protein